MGILDATETTCGRGVAREGWGDGRARFRLGLGQGLEQGLGEARVAGVPIESSSIIHTGTPSPVHSLHSVPSLTLQDEAPCSRY